jgi:hypothetical protein
MWNHGRRQRWGKLAITLVATGVWVSYAATARHTRGHEADFGKQWLAGRMVATGQAAALYDPTRQRAELEQHLSPATIERGIWREGIGGPTYPPVQAVLFAPFGWLPPALAQWLLVEFSLLLVAGTGWMVHRLTDGRVSMAAAVLAILWFPGFFFCIGVGQNTAFTLAIVVAGWTLMVRGRAYWAGAVWGLLAFKPTWGLALVWVPLAVRRPRTYVGMLATGSLLVLASTAVCGLDAWLDWLRVAHQTEQYYETLPRWIGLSRDLPGLARRLGAGTAADLAAGMAMLGVVAANAWVCGNRRTAAVGPVASAVWFGVVLTCPRYMFYDATLALFPLMLAWAGWKTLDGWSRLWLGGLSAMLWVAPLAGFLAWEVVGWPLETFAVVGLWLWSLCVARATWRPLRPPGFSQVRAGASSPHVAERCATTGENGVRAAGPPVQCR